MSKKRFLVRALIFVAIFAVILYFVCSVLSFKYQDGILTLENYYDLPSDTVDVLMLGSSHIGVNVDNGMMFEKYGIASYSCWGAMQPIWNTYYYLEECLKTQTPKAVVLDVYGATYERDYLEYSYAAKNTLALPFSMEKYEAVNVTTTESNRSALLLGLPAYHSRYAEINASDFEYFFWNRHTDIQTIESSGDLVYPTEIMDTSLVSGAEELTPKSEEYLRKTLELCKSHGIPAKLIASPFALTELEQRRFNRIREIASEYGFEFTNYNDSYKSLGIDPEKDYRDEAHLNDSGIAKYTAALARSLKSSFELPDRREDATHIWHGYSTEPAKPVFELQNQFIGDGKQNYVDTGLPLYSNPLASWTILAEFEAPIKTKDDQVLFACYDETENDYHGLNVHGKSNGSLLVTYSTLAACEIRDVSGTVKLVVIKDGSRMQVYCNNELVQDLDLGRVGSYEGNLLIGCQENTEGRRFRYSATTVHALEVYDRALDAGEVLDWAPDWPPVASDEEKIVTDASDARLKLSRRFEGDGVEKYLDTGLELYKAPQSSWTLLAQLSPDIEAGDTVYFACFNEADNQFRGLLARRTGTDTLNIMYGNAAGVNVTLPKDECSTLAVVKDGSVYTMYLNGEKVLDAAGSECDAYGGSLLVGAEYDGDGNVFRYSGTTVYNLWVVDGVLDESSILSWSPEYAPPAIKQSGSDTEYTLEDSFAGNKKSAFVDTGIRLYDVADKSWSVSFQLELDESCTGSIISCFCEEPTDYRGLFIRQTGENSFGMATGKTYSEFTVPQEKYVAFTLVKNGFDYTLYIDGELALTAEGRCAAYSGPLMIGCERQLNGKAFRFSQAKIKSLSVTREILSAEQAMDYYKSMD